MKEFQVDFFVVGAARCGTTSLYNYFNQHPQLFLPKIKELNYFSDVESKDYSVYKKPKKDKQYHAKIIKSYDAYKKLFNEATDQQLRGDVSPSYLWDKQTAQRIFDHNPKAKIIISLRNPVFRAFSHYVMNYSIGFDNNNNFKDALKAKRETIWGGGNIYLELSTYFESLQSYYQLFKKENIKILVFEDWTLNKDTTLVELFNFFGVDNKFKVNLAINHNEKRTYKNIKSLNFLRNKFIKRILDLFIHSKAKNQLKAKFFTNNESDIKMNPDIQQELKEYFRNDVEQLQDFLEMPLLSKWDFED